MDKLRKELSALKVDTILDVATRDGGFAKEMLLGLGECKKAVALDITDKMFEKGREKCAGLPVEFVVGDGCAMDFPDDSFDIVAVANSLHHIPDLEALFREMRRVVKPDGLLLISEMYNDGQPKASLTHWILHDLDCDMHTLDGIYHHPTYSKGQILWMVKNAGFAVEKTLCDLVDDPKVLAKLRERVAAVPENLKKYAGRPEYSAMAAKAAWLQEEYDANGVTSAEQLVIFARK